MRRPGDKSWRVWIGGVLLGGATLSVAVWLAGRGLENGTSALSRPDPAPSGPNSRPEAGTRGGAHPEGGAVSGTSAGTLLVEAEWRSWSAEGRTAAGQGRDTTRAFVLRLRNRLDRLPPADRTAVVLEFLESGEDVRFGSDFRFATGGVLQEWPTLRVALLDYLAQRDPEAARVLAGALLDHRPDEPGEWTLAFRELARGHEARGWPVTLRSRVRDFLQDPEWRAQSPRSWLEGFDAVVAGGMVTELPELSRLAAGSGGASEGARFAAFLAADRLMLHRPVEILAALNRAPALFASEPNVRAGIFARADVRDREQRRQLEAYWLRHDVTAVERAAFTDQFPFYDLALSANLLTVTPTRPLADLRDQDRATLKELDRWRTDPRFAPWKESFAVIARRLRDQLAE